MDKIRDEVMGKWDYSKLPAGIRTGAGCYFERREIFARYRSRKDPGLVIGERVRIYAWSSLNVDPEGRVRIGDDSVLVGAVLMCADSIDIGNRVQISYHVTIADSDFHPVDPEERQRDAVACSPQGNKTQRPEIRTQPVVIEDDVWIGIGALILKGVRIGRGARIGAGAVVTKDVAAGSRVEGNPARPVEKLSGDQ